MIRSRYMAKRRVRPAASNSDVGEIIEVNVGSLKAAVVMLETVLTSGGFTDAAIERFIEGSP